MNKNDMRQVLDALSINRVMAKDSSGNYTREITPKLITAAIALCEASLATPQEAAAPGWLQIETAPKDGTKYLAYAPDGGRFVENQPAGHYAGDWTFNETRNQWRGYTHGCEATHWMPLPPEPKP